ncbi:MAG: glycosyltransferase family 2 protein [Bacteroidetes bacterium]|nr:glycosyltransferase family 2 protein [Bacteroidota bacterium]
MSTYVQVVFLLVFIDKRREISEKDRVIKLSSYPKVAVIVPCWNEEKTVHKTVESILNLNYPKDRLEVFIIDDGSTDTTWQEILKYKNNPQVKMFQKENGGKHTAVNFGIDKTDADFISCLDSDSFVERDALVKILSVFEKNKEVMTVSPSVIVHNPKNFLQAIQKVEYNMSLYIKKMLSFMNGIHVTPGPFSVFKRDVFEKIGKFRKAHNTEDAEIAFRMQVNHMKIEHCHDAHVFTVAPNTVRKLFHQRLRWNYGFIQNVYDYRYALFNRKYGSFSLFTLPAGIFSIIAVIYIFFSLIYNIVIILLQKIEKIQTVGIDNTFSLPSFDPFFFNTKALLFVSVLLYGFLFLAIIRGHRMAKDKKILNRYIIPYMATYSILAPLWLVKSIYNSVVVRREVKWR